MACRTENVNGRDWLFCDSEAEAQEKSASGNPIKGCWWELWDGPDGKRNVQNCASLEEAVEESSRDDELRNGSYMMAEADAVGLLGLPKLLGSRFAESLGVVKTKDTENYVASYREPTATPQVVQAGFEQINELIPLLEQYIRAGEVGIMAGAVDTGHMVSPAQIEHGLSQARMALDGLKSIRDTAGMVELGQAPGIIQERYAKYFPELRVVLDGLKTHLKHNILHDMGRCFGTSIAEASSSFRNNIVFNFLSRYPEYRSASYAATNSVINGPTINAVKNASSGLPPWGKVAVYGGLALLAVGAATYFWLTSDE